jgi:hypothetical protein
VSPRIGAFAATFALTNATACPPAKDGPLPLPTAPVAGTVLVMGNISDAETPLENGEELKAMIQGPADGPGHHGPHPVLPFGVPGHRGRRGADRGELPADGTRCAA